MTKNNEKLTSERVRFLFDYNPASGDLLWRNPTSTRCAVGDRVGVMASNGRRYVGVDGIKYLAHRIAWLYVHGALPDANIAAKNENYDDLRLDNLYPQSFSETATRNQTRRTNTSGIRGVIWDKDKGKWRAEITRDYQRIMLGRFDTREEAHDAYTQAVRSAPVKPADPEQRRQFKVRKTLEAQVRRLWKRVLRDNSGSSAWHSYAAFAADVQGAIKPRTIIVKINDSKPIGPKNYQWIASAAFDHRTPEGRLIYKRHYRERDPEVTKDQDLRKTFGIGLEQYRAMLTEQNGVCAICKQPEVEIRKGKLQALGVDHCHTTGAIRGLLCTACNSGIARFKDNPDYLRAAIVYLEHHATIAKSAPASNVIHLKTKER